MLVFANSIKDAVEFDNHYDVGHGRTL